MLVGDPGFAQRRRERLATELGLPARTRREAHIRESADGLPCQQPDEHPDRVRRVTDRPDPQSLIHSPPPGPAVYSLSASRHIISIPVSSASSLKSKSGW